MTAAPDDAAHRPIERIAEKLVADGLVASRADLEVLRACAALALYRQRSQTPGMSQILADVAHATGVPAATIKGPTRGARAVAARYAFMAQAHATGRYSLAQIGRFVHRDHSTVVYGLKRHAQR